MAFSPEGINVFPFHYINDEEFRHINSDLDISESLVTLYEKTAEFDFLSFEYTDYLHRNYVDYIDPDNNFYKDIKIDCSYYIEAKFEHKTKCINALSMIRFNAQSLNANFKNIKEFLYVLHTPLV